MRRNRTEGKIPLEQKRQGYMEIILDVGTTHMEYVATRTVQAAMNVSQTYRGPEDP